MHKNNKFKLNNLVKKKTFIDILTYENDFHLLPFVSSSSDDASGFSGRAFWISWGRSENSKSLLLGHHVAFSFLKILYCLTKL